jgi:glycosyltransferase involved in cell wall biosynthesis
MTNILIISHYALPHLGGIEVVVDALAQEFTSLGHRVTHLAADVAGGGSHPAEPLPYETIRVPAWNPLETKLGVPWPIYSPRLLTKLVQTLRTTDVVHAHGLLYMGSALGLLLAKRFRQPRVLTEHVGHVHYSNPALDRVECIAMATLGRVTARSADAITVLNDKVKNEMAALAPSTRILSIPNGVDTKTFHPPTPDERRRLRAELGWDDSPRILFVGRLVAKKGITLAVEAVRRLRGRAQLVVVGPGELKPATDVEVLGALPRQRVAELYRAADVFLLPSRGEGFPLTAQEAMASGLPVVLAEDPAYAPYLGEGLQTAAAEPEALAAAVELWLSPDRRAKAGAAAAQRAMREFSWRTAAQKYLSLYEEIRAAQKDR